MTNYQQTLIQLNKNLAILRQQEAAHGGELNAPVNLLNQIDHHQQAIRLTEQARAGEITKAEWREATKPLLAFSNGQVIHIQADTYVAGDQHIHHHPPATGSPPRRGLYLVVGLFAGIAVNIALNLLSAAIQQKLFAGQFSTGAIWGLAIFAVVGSLLGLWLSGLVTIPANAAPAGTKPIPAADPNRVNITRLRALFSYTKLKGKGVTLTDILLIASKLEINTGE